MDLDRSVRQLGRTKVNDSHPKPVPCFQLAQYMRDGHGYLPCLCFFGEDMVAKVQICLALNGAHAYINQPTKRNVFSSIRRTHISLVDFMLLLIRNINAKQAEIAN